MDGFKLINEFFDVIDGFNEQGIYHIKDGDIQGAIGIYKLKSKFISYAYHNDIINIEKASTMLTDNSSIIRLLLGGVKENEANQ